MARKVMSRKLPIGVETICKPGCACAEPVGRLDSPERGIAFAVSDVFEESKDDISGTIAR